MLNIEQPSNHRYALHHLGFRPFFLLAGLFAVTSMLVWSWIYHYPVKLPFMASFSSMSWHAHEMVFGYAMAAIAGFLLTAIRNWTNQQTLNGPGLMILALLWLLARFAPFIDHPMALTIMALADTLFSVVLIPAMLIPMVVAGTRQHYFIVGVVALICACNISFYAGVLMLAEVDLLLVIKLGLYLILALIMIMGRRVIPFFIEKGIDTPTTITNYRWLDISSLILMGLFILLQLFQHGELVTALVALSLAVLHSIRLYGWYSPDIWRKPLLWILYLAYIWIVIGFAMTGLHLVLPQLSQLATHAFAVGGIGMMTLGMMARVSLGHTGRNVFDPPAILNWIFVLLAIGSVARIILAGLLPAWYGYWIGLAQLCWIAAFALFSVVYAPMFIKARVDGRYG